MSPEVEDVMWLTDTFQTISEGQNTREITEMAMQNRVKIPTLVVSFRQQTATFFQKTPLSSVTAG